MSLILDALRKGRARATPPPSTNAAQTNAVLHTLGYGRLRSASPLNKILRLASYVVAALILSIAIWAGVVWSTQAYLTRRRPAVVRTSPAPALRPPAAPAAPVVKAPNPGAPAAHVSELQTAGSSGQTTPVTSPPAAATPTPAARRHAAAVRPPSPAGPAPAPPPATLPIVQNSRRPDVSFEAPLPPAGAPSSRTVLSTPAGSNAGKVVSESDHFQLALYYQRIGDFENSLVHYRAVLQRDELNAEAHNNLGLLYRDKGLLDDAVKEFGRAIAINQRYVKAHNNLGVAYLSQGRNDAAAAEFRTALNIDPRNVESLVNLSLAEKETGQRVDARATLARAIEIDPRSAEAHYNLALIADDMGDRATALAQYRIFLQYATDHPDLVPDVRKRIDALSR